MSRQEGKYMREGVSSGWTERPWGGCTVSDGVEMTESAGRYMALGNTCKQTQCH